MLFSSHIQIGKDNLKLNVFLIKVEKIELSCAPETNTLNTLKLYIVSGLQLSLSEVKAGVNSEILKKKLKNAITFK